MKITKRELSLLIENYLFEGKYPYESRKEKSDSFRKWLRSNKPNAAIKFDITSDSGSATWWGLGPAYDLYGGDYHRDQSSYGTYLPDKQDDFPDGTKTLTAKEWKSEQRKAEKGKAEAAAKKQQPKDDIQYYSRLPKQEIDKIVPTLKKGKEATFGQYEFKGCAKYVNNITGYSYGNAWHQHAWSDWSAFDTAVPLVKDDLAEIFTKINSQPSRMDSKQYVNKLRGIVRKMVPGQSQFKKLELGDVVGLYHHKSSNFAIAFYEAGSDSWGKGLKDGDYEGPFFTDEEGNYWEKSMRGKNINFKPAKELNSKGFGLNTHIGLVGMKINGEPIIFHNVDKSLKATPLRALSTSGDAICWYRKGETFANKARRWLPE